MNKVQREKRKLYGHHGVSATTSEPVNELITEVVTEEVVTEEVLEKEEVETDSIEEVEDNESEE